MNLIELLDNAAARWPEKPAFIEDDQPISYRDLVERTHQLASALASHGISAGQRVGVHFPNCVNCVALTFALWKLRAVVIPLAVECTDAERVSIVESLHVQALIGLAPTPGALKLAEDCFLTRTDSAMPPDNHGLDVAFIRFTSGTTSARKGVVLCHDTIRDRIATANQALGIDHNDTVVWCLPMAHHFLVTIALYIAHGATVVLARHVLAEPYRAAIQRWNATVLYASPFHLGMLAQLPDTSGIPSVRLAVSTTCSLPNDIARAFQQRFGITISQALGVIEAGLVCLNRDPNPSRWNSVGRPIRGFEAKILSPTNRARANLPSAVPACSTPMPLLGCRVKPSRRTGGFSLATLRGSTPMGFSTSSHARLPSSTSLGAKCSRKKSKRYSIGIRRCANRGCMAGHIRIWAKSSKPSSCSMAMRRRSTASARTAARSLLPTRCRRDFMSSPRCPAPPSPARSDVNPPRPFDLPWHD